MYRILVINVARFGDTLLVTPVLRALKKHATPGELAVLAHPKRVDVLCFLPFIDRLGAITKHSAVWRGRWPAQPFDAALVYGGDRALIHYALRVSERVIAFQPEKGKENWPYPVETVPRPEQTLIAVEERALLCRPLGIEPADWRLAYQVAADEEQWAQHWIGQRALQGRRLVGLQLQSFPTKAYRDWPEEHFFGLAQRLLAADPSIQLLLLGDKAGRDRALRLQNRLGSRATVVAGEVSMRQNAALMARLALYVGVDTGPTHIAGALGIPMVALYHCAHPGKFLAPRQHPRLSVIEHPGYQENGRADMIATMADVSVEQVWQCVAEQLDLR